MLHLEIPLVWLDHTLPHALRPIIQKLGHNRGVATVRPRICVAHRQVSVAGHAGTQDGDIAASQQWVFHEYSRKGLIPIGSTYITRQIADINRTHIPVAAKSAFTLHNISTSLGAGLSENYYSASNLLMQVFAFISFVIY